MNRSISVHNVSISRSRSIPGRISIAACIPYVYYAFVFTLPLQVVDTGIPGVGFSRLFGYALMLSAMFHPQLCFASPPKAFKLFAAYLVVYSFLGSLVAFDPHKAGQTTAIITQLTTLIQLLILFWISYNLLRSERRMKGTLLALAFSCIFLSGLLMIGSADGGEHRASAFGENPNILATVLSLGVLALVGLAYGRRINEKKLRILSWFAGPLLLILIVRTGSRGNLLALLLAMLALVIKPHAIRENLKTSFMVLVAITTLAFASYQIEFVRERWERTFEEGDVAGRENIYGAAVEMFLDSPIIGWGPVNHYFELGSRLGLLWLRDPHNIYLWILNETGLVGAVLFFGGLWLCWSSAWKARKTTQGVVPMVMLFYLLLANLKGSGHFDKFFWLVLAYAAAAGTHSLVVGYSRRPRNAVSSKRRGGPQRSRNPSTANSMSLPRQMPERT